MSFCFKLIFKVVPMAVVWTIVYGEWMSGLYGMGNTAHWAHIGGAVGGLVFLYLFKGKLGE